MLDTLTSLRCVSLAASIEGAFAVSFVVVVVYTICSHMRWRDIWSKTVGLNADLGDNHHPCLYMPFSSHG